MKLVEVVNVRVGSYSGGMKRWLSVVIVFIGDLKIVYFDELVSIFVFYNFDFKEVVVIFCFCCIFMFIILCVYMLNLVFLDNWYGFSY